MRSEFVDGLTLGSDDFVSGYSYHISDFLLIIYFYFYFWMKRIEMQTIYHETTLI
jgi:hypothetical protein